MSVISGSGTGAGEVLTSLLRSTASASASSPAYEQASSSPKNGDNPAVVVDLSDKAKGILERNKVAQAAADKLEQQVAAMKGDGKPAQAAKPKNDGAAKLFDALSDKSSSEAASQIKWDAGSKWGDASISDVQFTAKYKDAMLSTVESYSPAKRQELEAAIANGTLKIQKASEVSGVNTHMTVSYNVGPGGGQGMSTSGYRPPTGAAKEAIESGNAVSMWTEDCGDVYITW